MFNLSDLEKLLEVKFNNKNFLKEAITHRSFINENPSWPVSQNERLEYLGDAVLELVVTEFLFNRYPNYNEGQLTCFRAALVNFEMLNRVAKRIGLEKYVLVSKGELRDSGRAKNVILANAVEALFGAVYIDQGYDVARRLIEKIILVHIDEVIKKELFRDPKSMLQEIIQERLKLTPTYKALKEEGPDHRKKFLVGVFFDEKKVATGSGLSKHEAETHAAKKALAKIKKTDDNVS